MKLVHILKESTAVGRCLVLTLMLSPFAVFGYYEFFGGEFLDDVFTYPNLEISNPNISDNSISVKGLRNQSATHITIPSTVEYEFGYADDGGEHSKLLTCTVTAIGEWAFSCCSSLTSVTIPNSVTKISDHAFYACSSLASMRIPDSVTTIGDGAFSCCSSLTSVTIPDSVTYINGYAFSGCSSLTSVTIPNSVTKISDYAFSACSSLTNVTILPDSVTYISGYAFSDCSSLTSVTIGNGLFEYVDPYAFKNCNALVDLTVSQFVMERRISEVLPYAFSKITRLVLDATVSAIYENAFYGCESLTTLEVDSANEHYFVSPMDGCLYDRDQTTLLLCPRDTTEIIVPHGVTKIGKYAFAYCTNLVSVAMPATLKTIGESAFINCTSLVTVSIPDSVTSIGDGAFGNCRMLNGVTIPSGVRELSTSAFNGCYVLWTEWYRTLADFAVNGRAYDLTQKAGDRAIADVKVNGNMSLDEFVLKDGKVYDSVLYVKNNADHAVNVTLPSMPLTEYKTFKGASPLMLPAYSQSILTITRVAGGNAGGNVFIVTREELETVQ